MSNEDTQTQQPNDLLSYISGQEFAATAEEAAPVSATPEQNPVQTPSAGNSENVQAAPEAGSTPQGVTTNAGTNQGDGSASLQQELERLQSQHQQTLSMLALIAQESKRREDALFERSIEGLTEDEQAAERERRRIEQVEEENALLRAQQAARQRSAAQTQEQIDKAQFANMVVARMGLPNDPNVLGSLMDSGNPQELVFRAQRLANFYKATQVTQAATEAQTAAALGVHSAGGEHAPSSAPKQTPARSGDLIGMMRERSYQSESQRA